MMQRVIMMLVVAALLGACNRSDKKEGQEASQMQEIVSATVEELLSAPVDYRDKEVAVSGMVTHVCRHGGQKCFILAGDGETQLRVVTGGEIEEFETSLEGSMVSFRGIFRIGETAEVSAEEAETGEHHTGEMPHSEAEQSDYFIEATEFREVTP